MSGKRYRLIFPKEPAGYRSVVGSALLECLRYAGLLTYRDDGFPGQERLEVTIEAPRGVLREMWFRQNQARAESFGVRMEEVE